MKKNLFIFLIIAPMFGLALAGVRVYYLMDIWRYKGPDVHFKVKSGEGFSSINHRLDEKGLISNPSIFYRYSKLKNLITKFKAGTFEIKSDSNMFDVLDALLNSSAIGIKITIPEGKNLYEIAEILEENKILKKSSFIATAKDPAFTKALGIEGQTVEGYLYPETYMLEPEMEAKLVIQTMYSTFKNKVKNLSFNTNLSKHETIILASVVEKETGASFERPIIAGVFHNRLKKRMRLQSDPTTIYGIWENYNGNLRKKHLLEKTPYNTYKIPSLPIGPIANPGLEAIKAALKPASHSYLYFVSQNDGTHVFSKTYAEHSKAVDYYQKSYKNRKGKSWRDLKQKVNQ